MSKNKSDAIFIGIMSSIILLVYFIIPEPIQYEGPAKDILPLANHFVVASGFGGILFSFFYFFKK